MFPKITVLETTIGMLIATTVSSATRATEIMEKKMESFTSEIAGSHPENLIITKN